MRSRTASALAISILAVLPTAGCYQGFEGTVNTQGPSGNGTDFAVTEVLQVQDATLVASPDNPGAANLVMTIINKGEADDALLTAKVASGATGATEGPVEVAAGQAVPTTVAFINLAEKPGYYADVTLSFRDAGSVTQAVAVVPGTDYYADYVPVIDVEETPAVDAEE